MYKISLDCQALNIAVDHQNESNDEAMGQPQIMKDSIQSCEKKDCDLILHSPSYIWGETALLYDPHRHLTTINENDDISSDQVGDGGLHRFYMLGVPVRLMLELAPEYTKSIKPIK